MVYPAVISIWAQNVCSGLESSRINVSKTNEALDAIECIISCVPPPGSPDYKPDDPKYQALRSQASSTLEAFSQFLPSATGIKLAFEVDSVFHVLRDHGGKARLLSPPLIRAMSGYLDAYKKAQRGSDFYDFMRFHEEWIRPLYRNLKPDNSGRVRLLPFPSYKIALTSNFTLV